MNLGIKHLSQNITPDTVGIIWLTDEHLAYNTPGVYEFNYLLNGVLIKSLTQSTEESQVSQDSNFFLSTSFGNPLFVGHVVVQSKDDIKKMYSHLEIASHLIKENSQVFIFNRSKNTANINIMKSLSEKFKELTFKNLNI
jgi:hypothetical protein